MPGFSNPASFFLDRYQSPVAQPTAVAFLQNTRKQWRLLYLGKVTFLRLTYP